MNDDEKLRLAQARAERAKARINATLSGLRQRLDPSTMASKAANDLRDRGSAIAASGIDAAKRNPGRVIGAGIVVLGLLNRRRIARLFRRSRRNDA